VTLELHGRETVLGLSGKALQAELISNGHPGSSRKYEPLLIRPVNSILTPQLDSSAIVPAPAFHLYAQIFRVGAGARDCGIDEDGSVARYPRRP
jgi:hypothetical protein